MDGLLTTDKTVADEKETLALMHAGQGRGTVPIRGRAVDKALRKGPRTQGQREAVKLILSAHDRHVGIQVRNLLRIAEVLRIPWVVLVGDAKQLNAVDASKSFAQLQQEDMNTVVEASLAGDIDRAFEKFGANIAQVKADNLTGAARWLALPPEIRANAGLMALSHVIRERRWKEEWCEQRRWS